MHIYACCSPFAFQTCKETPCMGKRRASDADAAPEGVAAKRRRGAAASASAASSASGAAQPAASNASGASQPAWMSAILKEVEELGRMPNRFKTPKNNEERAENQLAKRIAQHKNDFPKDVWESMRQPKTRQQNLLNEVRTLGRHPVEHKRKR